MEKLDVVLAEYNALRSEIIDKFRIHIQMYTIFTSALLIIYGWIILNKFYDILLIIPIFTLVFASRFIWEQYVIIRIGDYIRDEIEGKKIPKLVGLMDETADNFQYSNLWMGWQHCWDQKSFPKYYQLSMFVLFFVLSYVPAIIFNCYNLLASIYGMTVYSTLSTPYLLLILIINLVLVIIFSNMLVKSFKRP